MTTPSAPAPRRGALRNALIYGLCGGLLFVILRLTEYRFLVIEHSVEIHGGLVAALFSALGIWLGIMLTQETGGHRQDFKVMPDFGEKFAAHMVERVRASGGTPQQVDETRRQAESFRHMYDNPLMNAALTFTEPFPIGLLVSVVSAGILRKK